MTTMKPVGSIDYTGVPTKDPNEDVVVLNTPVENGSAGSIEASKQEETKQYPIRFVILLLFCCYSMSNAFQWIQFAIITDVISDYYNVSNMDVNWTSVVYMVVYIPLIFPASWLLDWKGLRFVILLGSFGTTLGAWIKCGSLDRDHYGIAMFGQTVTAMSQIFILSIPPKLAATWFSDEGVSRACAVGVFGNQIGIALGFVIPPQVISNSPDKMDVRRQLQYLYFGIAIFCTVLFAAIILLFRDKPPLPPSRAQANLKNEEKVESWVSIRNLLKNKNYLLLLVTYGMNVGVFYAVSTLLNQMVLSRFEGEGKNAGYMGLSIVLAGTLGSVVCGFILDKTHKYKETTIAVYILSLFGMIFFTAGLRGYHIWPLFLACVVLGFFMTGYLPIGFEFAAEITYPEPEFTSSGLLNASAQIFGIIFTFGASPLLDHFGDIVANLTLSVALLVGAILTAFTKSDLRRQRAAAGITSSNTAGTIDVFVN